MGFSFFIIHTKLWAHFLSMKKSKGSENMVLNDSYSFMILSDFSMICVRRLWDESERTLKKVYFFFLNLKLFKRNFYGMSFFFVLIKYVIFLFSSFKKNELLCLFSFNFFQFRCNLFKQTICCFSNIETRKQRNFK